MSVDWMKVLKERDELAARVEELELVIAQTAKEFKTHLDGTEPIDMREILKRLERTLEEE